MNIEYCSGLCAQMFLHRIQMNVMEMLLVILGITNPMIRKAALPNLHVRSKFFLGAKARIRL